MSRKGIVLLAVVALMAGARAESRGWLGIYQRPLDEPLQAALGTDHGIMIQEVVENSPADKAGLKLGDVILQIDSQGIQTSDDLSRYVGERPDQTVQVELLRRGKTETVPVRLGTRERQLELKLRTPLLEDVNQMVVPSVEGIVEDYGTELRKLRNEMLELKKEIERLRKDLKKLER